MLKHYTKFAFRNFRSNKVIFAGSLTTLCLGALCISLLFSYVHNELTMDDFHKGEKDIYMMTMKRSPKAEWGLPYKFTPEDFPEIEGSVNLIFFKKDGTKIKFNQDIYTPIGMVADSTFFDVFGFELSQGNPKSVLYDSDAIILSETFSKKLFGNKNPIGQHLDFEVRMYQGVHTVRGIVKIPSNSSFKFDYIIPYVKHPLGYGRRQVSFFKATKGFDKNKFEEKIKYSNNNVPNVYPQLTESITSLVSLDDIYFSSELNSLKTYTQFSSGNKKNIDILLVIMLVILLVSILNYSNLQIINTNAVLKNIAISKVNGALRHHIIGQKIIETIIIIILSTLLITLGYNFLLPWFNDFVRVFLAPPIWKIFLINAIILSSITIIGLIYPMLIINRFSTINNLKKTNSISQKLKGKQVTVVLQYAMAFLLLISSIIVNNQLKLMLDKDLGFNDDGILKVKLYYEPPFNTESRNWTRERRLEEREKAMQIPKYINNQLASFSSIKQLSQGRSPLDVFPIDWKPKAGDFEFETLNSLVVTPNHQNLFNFNLIEGRFFEEGVDKQRGKKIVINEAAKKHWGIEDIENTIIGNRNWGDYEIIGVVEDFNYEHLSAKPQPLMMVYFEDFEAEYFMKFHKNKTQEGIQHVEALFKELNPNQVFKYSFLSDEITALYQKEKRLSTIYIVFTIIALLISAIGLFTIALYDTQRRIKEIGVRKVNGASINEIMLMLNKDFIKWVVIAFIIACPIAYYAMSKWLENFAYKTTLSWWVFALAGMFTLVIALLTVSWQTYNAATRNPVESLRDE
ncbi:ABC transporter permease [Tamlana sp. 2201CG12-4]|uniref:ABC transporter permease n=1 Tax=Tamlana sp. 2201CG12-4 TaxID=3112582 RepID=UPI002DBE931D|nr:ABC transporter permease [Tamlana sp. 2201CG12-4]MEC3907022.1 ABC transporter permease [Tamlana sp. 2201CG12-4]